MIYYSMTAVYQLLPYLSQNPCRTYTTFSDVIIYSFCTRYLLLYCFVLLRINTLLPYLMYNLQNHIMQQITLLSALLKTLYVHTCKPHSRPFTHLPLFITTANVSHFFGLCLSPSPDHWKHSDEVKGAKTKLLTTIKILPDFESSASSKCSV